MLTKLSRYQNRKAAVREAAITWQSGTAEQVFSYSDLLEAQARFETLARRFGLTREFRENGII